MRVLVLSITAATLAPFARADQNLQEPTSVEVPGIVIEECRYDRNGIDVHFRSTFDGPHVVAVFNWSEMCWPARYRPLFSVVTDRNDVHIDGDFCTYQNGFVQVFIPGITNGWDRIEHVYKSEFKKVTQGGLGFEGNYVPTNRYKNGERLYVWEDFYVKQLVAVTVTNHIAYTWPKTLEARQNKVRKLEIIYAVDIDRINAWHDVADGMSDAYLYGRSNAWPINRLLDQSQTQTQEQN